MIASKPVASLSSGLLARKGQAKPAMRPQGFHSYNGGGSLEDLGWNDMGADVTPAPAPIPAPSPVAAPVPLPTVLRQREELAEEFAPRPAPKPKPEPRRGISLATAQRIGRETRRGKGKTKAAFTLRLDMERHLGLRLASAIDGRSSQQLVTEALDRLLADIPELTTMLDQLAHPRKD